MAPVTIDVRPLYDVFRHHLLTYAPESGAPSLAETLSGGLAVVTDAFPRGDLRILNVKPRRTSEAPYFAAELEVLLFHRPQTEAATLEGLADIVNEALDGFENLDVGVFEVQARDRDTARRFSERADPEIVENVSTFDLVLFRVPPAAALLALTP